MKTEHLFRPAVPFLAAISFLASAQAHSADLVKPVNSNVIALPAVQKPVVDVKPVIDAKPVIDVKPVSIKPVVAPVVTLKEPGLPTERKSGAIQPAAMDEKAMTVKTFTPATISSKESASPPIGDTVGLAKPGVPDGPMLSPLDDPRKPKHKAGGKIDKSDFDKKRQDLQDKKDSIGEMSEQDQMKLQQVQDKRATSYKVLSEIQKKSSDTAAGIVQNMK